VPGFDVVFTPADPVSLEMSWITTWVRWQRLERCKPSVVPQSVFIDAASVVKSGMEPGVAVPSAWKMFAQLVPFEVPVRTIL